MPGAVPGTPKSRSGCPVNAVQSIGGGTTVTPSTAVLTAKGATTTPPPTGVHPQEQPHLTGARGNGTATPRAMQGTSSLACAASGTPSPETDNEQSPATSAAGVGRRQADVEHSQGVDSGDGAGGAGGTGEVARGRGGGGVTSGKRANKGGRPNKHSYERGVRGRFGTAGVVKKSEEKRRAATSKEDEVSSSDGDEEEEGEGGSEVTDEDSLAEDGETGDGGSGVSDDAEDRSSGGEDAGESETARDKSSGLGNKVGEGGSSTDSDEDEEDAVQQQIGGMSEYELQRLERIKKNQAFMATLGLDAAKPVSPPAGMASGPGLTAAKGGKKRRRPVSRPSERVPSMPVRRSARTRGGGAVDYSEVRLGVFCH